MNTPRHGLCENPDCGAILDEPGVLCRDTYTGLEVRLCEPCAKSERYEDTNEGSPRAGREQD